MQARLTTLFTAVSVVLLYVVITLLTTQNIQAHPGNTASDGAHYCWTRCAYWGEVYGERHSHSGGYATPEVDYEDYDAPDPPEPDYDTYTPNSEVYESASQPVVASASYVADDQFEAENDNTFWWILGGLAIIGGGWLYAIRDEL